MKHHALNVELIEEDDRARRIDQMISEKNFVILNDGSMTFKSWINDKESALDAIIIISNIWRDSDIFKCWHSSEFDYGHRPISLNSSRKIELNNTYIRRSFKKTDW